ncbi:MAG: gliding motility-associated C-terminal domain-containing protein [Bacteroidales bacterium]|nr:gliding motility-associated C-terminal domain-containing protein [Bacteroidales bacterium]
MKNFTSGRIFIFLIVFVLVFFGTAQKSVAQQEKLQNIKVTVTFSSVPRSTQALITPLKYNKKFALVLQMDDGLSDIYNLVWPFFTGKDGNPGLFSTDGAGHNVPFHMSCNNFVWQNGKDVHSGTSGYLTWPEIWQLWQDDFTVSSRGFDDPTISYLQSYEVERNQSYTTKKTIGFTPGGIQMDSYVLPQNGDNQLLPGRSAGYVVFFDDYGNNDLSNPLSIESVSQPYNQHVFKRDRIDSSLFQKVQYLAQTSTNYNHWVGFYHARKFGTSPDIPFPYFQKEMDSVENYYGKKGSDNIWVAGTQEFFEYETLTHLIQMNSESLGNQVNLTFSGTNIPTNFKNYTITVLVIGDEPVSNINVTGASLSEYGIRGGDTAVINLSWKGQVIDSSEVVAEKYIQLAKAAPSDSVPSLVAADYVEAIQNADSMSKYRDELCTVGNPALKEFCSYHFSVSDSTICAGDTAALTAPAGMKHYLWNTGDTTQSIRVSPAQNTTYTVTVTTQDDKTGSASALVIVYPVPVFEHSPDTLVAPPGYDTLLWVSSGYDYLWSTGSKDTSILIKSYQPENYSVKVSTNHGCSVNQNFYVVPGYKYNVNFKYDTVCMEDTTRLVNISTSNDSVTSVSWDLNTDGVFGDAKGNAVNYVFPNSGIHLVGMRINYASGAVKTVVNQVPVGDFPKANFVYRGVCAPSSSTTFTDSSTVKVGTIISRFWDFGDGQSEYRSDIFAYHYYAAGTHNVRLGVTSSMGCSDTITKPVTIYSDPNVVVLKGDGTRVYYDDTVKFARGDSVFLKVDNPTSYDSIIWPNDISGPDYYLKKSGIDKVTAYRNVCSGSSEFIGYFLKSAGKAVVDTAHIMSVFTPNGDGYNDKWVIKSDKIQQPIEVWVYNRAGNMVYHSSHYNNDWNGEYNGIVLPNDTYYYVIKDETGVVFTGTITILR